MAEVRVRMRAAADRAKQQQKQQQQQQAAAGGSAAKGAGAEGGGSKLTNRRALQQQQQQQQQQAKAAEPQVGLWRALMGHLPVYRYCTCSVVHDSCQWGAKAAEPHVGNPPGCGVCAVHAWYCKEVFHVGRKIA